MGGGLETTRKLKTILQINSQVKAEGETLSQSLEQAQEREGGSGKGHTLRILGKIL